MNNQVKLIDAEKLKMWILQNDAAEAFMESVDSSDAFSNLCFAIDNGAFDPDNPPVPTIKPGDKVRHPYYGIGEVFDTQDCIKAKYFNGTLTAWSDPSNLEAIKEEIKSES